jgi:hypothetical protein
MKHLLYSITDPVVCAKCADEFASGGTDAASLRDYVTVDVGFSDQGVQVWCRRHELNVVHIDFDDARPNADFRCLERKTE